MWPIARLKMHIINEQSSLFPLPLSAAKRALAKEAIKMSMYKYVRDLWKEQGQDLKNINKQRILEWRRSNATVRIEKPTRIDRARSLGYKAKQGYIVVRQRVIRGGHSRARVGGGRRSKRFHYNKNLKLSYQSIAERRANESFHNCEVLNSYYLGQDGRYYWYEVILVDPSHPAIKADPRINWICTNKHKGRIYRGLTSSAKKTRKRTTFL